MDREPFAALAPLGYLDFGCFALDLDGRILLDPSGRGVALRRREFDLLLTLARSPGRVISRDALLDAIAGREAEAFDRTIDVYVGRLRRKIEADPRHPRVIVTVPGVGYRLAVKPRPATRPSGVDAQQHLGNLSTCAGLGMLMAFNTAYMARNAEAMSGLYADSAVVVMGGGVLSGRATIEQWHAAEFEHFIPDLSKLERIMPIGEKLIVRAGTWSGTDHRRHRTARLHGSWTTTDICEGGIWKILTETILMVGGESNGSAVG